MPERRVGAGEKLRGAVARIGRHLRHRVVHLSTGPLSLFVCLTGGEIFSLIFQRALQTELKKLINVDIHGKKTVNSNPRTVIHYD